MALEAGLWDAARPAVIGIDGNLRRLTLECHHEDDAQEDEEEDQQDDDATRWHRGKLAQHGRGGAWLVAEVMAGSQVREQALAGVCAGKVGPRLGEPALAGRGATACERAPPHS